MVIVAGIAWGISGVSGQYLMGQGVPVELITVLRLLISGVFLTVWAILGQRERMKETIRDKKSLGGILVFSILGLVLNQWAYLTAIQHSNAGTATVLQYLCPILVLGYTCLRQRQQPTVTELVSILLAIGGTFLIATHGDIRGLAVTPQGLFWGIFSAITYALYIILPISLIQRYGSLVVIGLGMLMGGILLSLGLQVWHYSLVLTPSILLGLFGIVGIGTIFAYTVFLQGVSIIGSVKGSLLAAIEPVASVFFSVLLLNEVFYGMDFLGMLLILAAVLLISIKDLMLQRKNQVPNQ